LKIKEIRKEKYLGKVYNLGIEGDESYSVGFIVHNSYGVNLPSFRVVMRDLKRYYPGIGAVFVPILDVQQMLGRAGRPAYDSFGEGIILAKSEEEAKKAAYGIAHSPLVKTAFFGEDANWGRILSALGHSDISLHQDRVDIFFDEIPIVKNGVGMGHRLEERASKVLKKKAFKLTVHLHQGKGNFSLLATDLSHDYGKINASYRS